ncbi:glycerol dehydratase reactivase beta/small subunit family protein [Mycolicibacterium vaccae]|uniref:glycerol dehydratase reactivase beta/small subunit family protein n=1 Tax=Mycolicibacterium vaccae TaxID=1810 RepID=UPI003CFF0F05
MPEGGQPDKPAILVFGAHACAIETEVLAGIEEEGVPFVVERPDAAQEATVLAGLAAARSSLSVGVGIDDRGRVCVQHQKLADPQPGLHTTSAANPVAARSLGHNAARMVVGIPLRALGLG